MPGFQHLPTGSVAPTWWFMRFLLDWFLLGAQLSSSLPDIGLPGLFLSTPWGAVCLLSLRCVSAPSVNSSVIYTSGFISQNVTHLRCCQPSSSCLHYRQGDLFSRWQSVVAHIGQSGRQKLQGPEFSGCCVVMPCLRPKEARVL